MPSNQNSVFKGYHVPFIGYTYTENSLMNDLVDMSGKGVILMNGNQIESNEIMKLKQENNDLTNKLRSKRIEI